MPGTAAAYTHLAAFRPLRVVERRAGVVVLRMPVAHPFPDVAMRVMETEGIWRKAADRRRESKAIARCERIPRQSAGQLGMADWSKTGYGVQLCGASPLA